VARLPQENAPRYDLQDRLLDFAARVTDVAEALPPTRPGNHIAGQLVRCGTSPAANHAEAQGAESRKDFVHKMRVSLKELRETRVWLSLVGRKGSIGTPADLDDVLAECEELVAIFAASIRTASDNGPHKRGVTSREPPSVGR
jgi:four helix bundle protein